MIGESWRLSAQGWPDVGYPLHTVYLLLRTFWTLSTGEGIGRVLHVIAFVLMARTFGKDALGEFALALAVSSYLVLLVQQGFDTLATREVSRSAPQVGQYAEAIAGLRIVLAAALCLPVAAYLLYDGLSKTTNLLLAVFSIRFFVTAVTVQWSFVALERPRIVAAASIASQGIFLATVAVIKSPSQILWAALGQVAGECIAAAILWYCLRQRTGSLRPVINAGLWRHLVLDGWPILLSLLLGNLLYNFDIFALGWLSTPAEIGLYLACYRCVTAFTPLLGAIHQSTFPRFSRTYPDLAAAKRIAWRVAIPVGLGGLVAAGAMNLGATWIMTMLYGSSFEDGASIVRVLAWLLPVQGLRAVIRQILIAFHLQRFDVVAMSLAVLTNVCLDVTLVPVWGAMGCAISTLVSELILLLIIFWFVSTRIRRAGTVSAASLATSPRAI